MPSEVAQKVADFFAQYKLQYFEKSQVLIRGGESPDGIYYLIGGQVRQYDISPNGDELVVNIFKPPSFFPMSWAINKTPNRYFFETYTKVVARKAPAKDVLQFLHDNPDVVFDLLSRVYKGTAGMQGRMTYLMQNSARARLLYELVLSCQRYGKARGKNYTLGLHETELATRVGLTRETINREMRALKQEGAVEVSQNGIVVKNLPKLQKELGLDS